MPRGEQDEEKNADNDGEGEENGVDDTVMAKTLKQFSPVGRQSGSCGVKRKLAVCTNAGNV